MIEYNLAVRLQQLLEDYERIVLSERIRRGIRTKKLLAKVPRKTHNEIVLRENR